MNFFGLDIGSQNVKIAQVEKVGDKFRLTALGSAPTPPPALSSESETDLTRLAELIKKVYQETKISTKNVASALPEDKIFTKLVTFPKLSEKELRSAIKWEAEQYVPIPLEEVTLDYQIMGESEQEGVKKSEVLLVAAPKRLIEKIIKVIKVAGLNPVSLETEMIALTRSLTLNSETSLLVDLGASATDMAIVEGNSIFFTRSVPTAGEALTRAVTTNLSLEFAQAEEYKKAYGVDNKKLEGKISEAVYPVLEVILREMKKAIQFYETSRRKTVKRVILTGGTANLPEIVSFLATGLNLEIQIGDPFFKLEKDNQMLGKISSGMAPFYATAVGLALKEIE